MKPFCLLLLGMIAWGGSPARAEVYRYVDDQGIAHYTNDLSSVPEDRAAEITEKAEYPIDTSASPRRGAEKATSSQKHSHPAPAAADQKPNPPLPDQLKSQKALLEAEYQSLLIQKAEIDSDASFQKRKDKKKYKHRPSVEMLIQKEEAIKGRLSDIETAIKRIESQL